MTTERRNPSYRIRPDSTLSQGGRGQFHTGNNYMWYICNRSDTYKVCTLIYRFDTSPLPILLDNFRYNGLLLYHITRDLHTSCCNSQHNYFQTNRHHTLSNKTKAIAFCVAEWRFNYPILIKSLHNLSSTYFKYMFKKGIKSIHLSAIFVN
mgnify:CR=1 FL=1